MTSFSTPFRALGVPHFRVGGAFLYPNLPFGMMIESKFDFHRSHLRSLLVGRSVKIAGISIMCTMYHSGVIWNKI